MMEIINRGLHLVFHNVGLLELLGSIWEKKVSFVEDG